MQDSAHIGLGSWRHLAARFLSTFRSRPLTAAETEEVGELLTLAESAIFFDQPPVDQRHGLEAARTARALGGAPPVVRAALLHDVGKRHSGLGVWGRSIASILLKLGLPLPKRMRLYRDHGPTGAFELERLTGDSLEARFARHHHSDRPPAIEPGAWELLQRADHERPTGTLSEPTKG